ncbi:MAG TPA: hypothetical protein VGK27_13555 [Candidatus Deferrimicrobiaceae bacterium]|jgi:hypothetical protein
MAFTDRCSIYAGVTEAGINAAVRLLMKQRPSLFNYGTGYFQADPKRFPKPITPAPDVSRYKNPLTTLVKLPDLGLKVPPDLCFQLTGFAIDFHPANTVALPSNIASLMKPEQRFSLQATVTAGVLNALDNIYPVNPVYSFDLVVYAIGHLVLGGTAPDETLSGVADHLEIVGIAPPGLDNALVYLARLVLKEKVLPKAVLALAPFTLDIPKMVGKVSVSATKPSPATVANNPAVEDDQVKVFVEVTAS